MAPKFFQFVAIFLLLVLQTHTIQSKPSNGDPFGFIQQLQGCHKGQSVDGLNELKKYLHKYGYLKYEGGNSHANDDEFDEPLESAIMAYQRYYHLNVTGGLDPQTVHQMMMPRCAEPDHVNGTNHYHSLPRSIHSVAHYQFFPSSPKWPAEKSHLRYKFRSGAQEPGTFDIRSVSAQAFQRWAQVSHFTFEEVPSDAAADIEIGFYRRAHGDGISNAFDGRSGVLAHATAPTAGKCHFDADENWSANPASNQQLDFESVAVHEIGHLLGLAHSDDRNAIMFASFQYGITKRDLREDDIQGIRTLYGLQ